MDLSQVEVSVRSPKGAGGRKVQHSPRRRLLRPKEEEEEEEKKLRQSLSPKKKSNDAEEEEECCLICMDEFTRARASFPLPCLGSCGREGKVHYRCIMAWLGQSGACPLCRGDCDPLLLTPALSMDFITTGARDFPQRQRLFKASIPLDAGILRCYVKQLTRGVLWKSVVGYELYLQQQPAQQQQQEDLFLLAARKQVRSNMTSNYNIYTAKDCQEASKIGRVGANFLGTVFTIYDNGRDPQKVAKIQDSSSSTPGTRNSNSTPSDSSSTRSLDSSTSPAPGGGSSSRSNVDSSPAPGGGSLDSSRAAAVAVAYGGESGTTPMEQCNNNALLIREELGCVTYEANRTSVGPRKMRVCIPQIREESSEPVAIIRPMNRKDRLVNRLNTENFGAGTTPGASAAELVNENELRVFINRKPVFRDDLGAYCLDFGGRVSMASVKNFQLISSEDPSMGNVLQFGRIGQDMFTMDAQWPLSLFQSFAICLSSCDTKLACV